MVKDHESDEEEEEQKLDHIKHQLPLVHAPPSPAIFSSLFFCYPFDFIFPLNLTIMSRRSGHVCVCVCAHQFIRIEIEFELTERRKGDTLT